MLTFFITTEERKRAQDRAAELDVSKSDPPGQYPYVWDNRMNCVKRWYDYGSPEDKLGTIYLEPLVGSDDRLTGVVECTTEITYHPSLSERQPDPVRVVDPEECKKLVEFFFRELLHRVPTEKERSRAGTH